MRIQTYKILKPYSILFKTALCWRVDTRPVHATLPGWELQGPDWSRLNQIANMAGQEDPVQREIHQDWANREYIEVITSSIKKIADFLNSFGKLFNKQDVEYDHCDGNHLGKRKSS